MHQKTPHLQNIQASLSQFMNAHSVKAITNITPTKRLSAHPFVDGLYFCDNFIDDIYQKTILDIVNNINWSSELSRRVQHYGYNYNYKKRNIDKINDYLGDLPTWTNEITNSMVNIINESDIQKIPDDYFDQLIVNEYKKGQGISAHTDCIPCFSDCICSVTLGNTGTMTFQTGNRVYDLELKKGSVIVMTGDARYKWVHSIVPTKNKNFTNETPRISLTFRHVQ